LSIFVAGSVKVGPAIIRRKAVYNIFEARMIQKGAESGFRFGVIVEITQNDKVSLISFSHPMLIHYRCDPIHLLLPSALCFFSPFHHGFEMVYIYHYFFPVRFDNNLEAIP